MNYIFLWQLTFPLDSNDAFPAALSLMKGLHDYLFPASSMLGFCVAWTCASLLACCSQTLYANMCISPVVSANVLPSPLAVRIFPSPLPQKSLSTPHSLLFSAHWQIVCLCIVIHFQRLLWWELRDTLLNVVKDKNLGRSLLLWPFSKIVLVIFPKT